VPDLIAKPALGQESLSRAGCTLAEAGPAPVTSIAPFPGQERAVDQALQPLGLAFPAPNAVSRSGAARLVWTGLGQAFLIGLPAPAALAGHAALTDQTDGWARLCLTGPAAAEALMRLVPLDLGARAFPAGRVARTGLNHMNLILLRDARDTRDSFELMVFRSMARTAWHEIAEALARIEARAARP
jgi:sarcosine oxidase subunit gamma